MATILVTGATGQQGGAVIDALLHAKVANMEVRAMTRNPHLAAAQSLVSRGVIVVKGDLFDRDSLLAALKGCDAAYLVTDFRSPEDVAGEILQGCQFIDCAKESGVKHVVFSSVAGADVTAKVVEHFYSKFEIEEYLRASGLSWTIVRPVGFMEVIPPPGIGRFFFISAMAALFGGSKQKWVACQDIGRAVARGLLDPTLIDQGKIVRVTGHVATIDEVQAALQRGDGTPIRRLWMAQWLVLALSPYHYKQMFQWLALGIQEGDVDETEKFIPGVLNIEAWARQQLAK